MCVCVCVCVPVCVCVRKRETLSLCIEGEGDRNRVVSVKGRSEGVRACWKASVHLLKRKWARSKTWDLLNIFSASDEGNILLLLPFSPSLFPLYSPRFLRVLCMCMCVCVCVYVCVTLRLHTHTHTNTHKIQKYNPHSNTPSNKTLKIKKENEKVREKK